MPKKRRSKRSKVPKRIGGSWHKPAGQAIWKLINGIWTLIGGPKTGKDAMSNFSASSQHGNGSLMGRIRLI